MSDFVDFDYDEADVQATPSLADFMTNFRRQLNLGFTSQVTEGPVMMLGRTYQSYEELIEDFKKLPWVTYRSGFHPIFRFESDSLTRELTSDAGWGCTIRTGQMLLMSALKRHHQKPDWPDIELLTMIQDNFSDAQFSLKQFTKKGNEMGKLPGDWFSPSNMCFAIEWLVAQHPQGLQAKVFLDGVIYEDQVEVLAQGLDVDVLKESCRCSQAVGEKVCIHCDRVLRQKGPWAQSVLVLLPLMLGLEMVNPELYSSYKAFLSLSSSVGVIGGKPRSALYIVGFQGDDLLYLDPHFVQPSAHNLEDLRTLSSSYSCSLPLLLPLNNAESSLGVGFLFTSQSDFTTFKIQLASLEVNCLLSIEPSTPSYLLFDEGTPGETLVFSDSDSEYILL